MKFLHIADVHLGCTRYQLSESPRDFFDAWIDVIEKYAIGEGVDFVVMSGDFFHKKSVPPETMNYAFAGLSKLREHGIPVVTIEGNHDQKHTDSDHSWLRSLSNWGLVHLLEPKSENGVTEYEPWNPDTKKGGYVDIGEARIFGSLWYGASANWAVPMLSEAIAENQRAGAFHILLLHTDVEGYETHPGDPLKQVNLKKLKSVTQYVALGHTHKSYQIENWAFNPGSLEVTNIAEHNEIRGAFLVEVDGDLKVTATHLKDYRQRPFQRLSFDVSGYSSADDVKDGVLAVIENQARVAENGEPKPILEVTFRGYLGFPNSLLDIKAIREAAQQHTGALHVRIKNHTAPIEYAMPEMEDEDVTREKLERKVVEDLVMRDARFKTKLDEVAEAVIGAKRMALSDEEPEKIAEFIALKAAGRDK